MTYNIDEAGVAIVQNFILKHTKIFLNNLNGV